MSVVLEDLKKLRQMTGTSLGLCKSALEEAGGAFDKAVQILREKGMASAAKKAGRVASEGRLFYVASSKRFYLFELNCETDFVAKTEVFKKLAQTLSQLIQREEPESLDQLLKVSYGQGNVAELIQESAGALGENLVLRRLVSLNGSFVQHYLHGQGKIGVLVALNQKDEEAALDMALQITAQAPEFLREEEVPEDQKVSLKATFKKQVEETGKPDHILDKIAEGKLRNWQKEAVLLEQVFIKNDKQTVREYLKEKGVEVESFCRLELGQESE